MERSQSEPNYAEPLEMHFVFRRARHSSLPCRSTGPEHKSRGRSQRENHPNVPTYAKRGHR
jgi:hypothetical protein